MQIESNQELTDTEHKLKLKRKTYLTQRCQWKICGLMWFESFCKLSGYSKCDLNFELNYRMYKILASLLSTCVMMRINYMLNNSESKIFYIYSLVSNLIKEAQKLLLK